MKRTLRDAAIVAVAILAFAYCVAQVRAEPQTRFYDAQGRSIGTAVPQGDGSVRYYNSQGSSIGTSTTIPSGTTTYYGPGGNVTGRAVGPSSHPSFSGARR